MLVENRLRDRDWSEDLPVCRIGAYMWPLHHGITVNGDDVDGFASLSCKALLLGDLVPGPVGVTKIIEMVRSIFGSRRFTAMQQDGDKLDFPHARYGEMHDTALWCNKTSLAFD